MGDYSVVLPRDALGDEEQATQFRSRMRSVHLRAAGAILLGIMAACAVLAMMGSPDGQTGGQADLTESQALAGVKNARASPARPPSALSPLPLGNRIKAKLAHKDRSADASEKEDSDDGPLSAKKCAAMLPEDMRRDTNASVAPCENFYEFSCGEWVKRTKIKADRTEVTRSWDGASDHVRADKIEMFKRQYPPGDRFHKLNDWFTSCMNLERIEALGPSPLKPVFDRIEAVQTGEDLRALMVYMLATNLPSPAQMDVAISVRNSSRRAMLWTAGGLMLPDSTYYTVSWNGTWYGSDRTAIRERTRLFQKKLNILSGLSEDEAEHVANLTHSAETKFAQWMMDEPDPDGDQVDQGPPLINLTALETSHPEMPWRRMVEAWKAGCQEFGQRCGDELLDDEHVLVMTSPLFYSRLGRAMDNETLLSIPEWRAWYRSHYVYNVGPLLNHDFLENNLWLEKAATGIEGLPPREHKCVKATTNGLSALSDQAFLKQRFPPEARADGWATLRRIKSSFLANLKEVDWMDNVTLARAIIKAERLQLNLGSQQEWHEFRYPVSRESYFDNSGYAYQCKRLGEVRQLSEAVDNKSWQMRATEVNAYYDNGLNALFIPAGVMQPPFFSKDYPMSQNFGGIGAIMGHEMSHGFDDTGSRYNENRVLEEWWSDDVRSEFKDRNKCIKTLYDGFKIAGKNVEGDLTLGENIADFGGLHIAYRAFLEWWRDTNGADSVVPIDQKVIFFGAYSQIWCQKEREKQSRLSVETDRHSPSPFRSNGPISQNADFASTFRCPVGAPMNPVHKCIMWRDVVSGGEMLQARRIRVRTAPVKWDGGAFLNGPSPDGTMGSAERPAAGARQQL